MKHSLPPVNFSQWDTFLTAQATALEEEKERHCPQNSEKEFFTRI